MKYILALVAVMLLAIGIGSATWSPDLKVPKGTSAGASSHPGEQKLHIMSADSDASAAIAGFVPAESSGPMYRNINTGVIRSDKDRRGYGFKESDWALVSGSATTTEPGSSKPLTSKQTERETAQPSSSMQTASTSNNGIGIYFVFLLLLVCAFVYWRSTLTREDLPIIVPSPSSSLPDEEENNSVMPSSDSSIEKPASVKMNIKFCSNCDAGINREAVFCPQCGAAQQKPDEKVWGLDKREKTEAGIILAIVGVLIQRIPGIPAAVLGLDMNTYGRYSLADAYSVLSGPLGALVSGIGGNNASNLVFMVSMAMYATWALILIGIVVAITAYNQKQ